MDLDLVGGSALLRRLLLQHLFISQKVLIKSCCRSQFPHKFVNFYFILSMMKDKLTDLCGNQLLQDDFVGTLCERSLDLELAGGSALLCRLLLQRIYL